MVYGDAMGEIFTNRLAERRVETRPYNFLCDTFFLFLGTDV